MLKVDPIAFAPFSKKQLFRAVNTWRAYGVFMPKVHSIIGLFWRDTATNEVHILIFADWRKRWPLRIVCRQMLDIWFTECDEIIAEIEERHAEARRLFELVGAEYRGFEREFHCYRLTAAMRKW